MLVLVNRGIKGFQVLGISIPTGLRKEHVETYNFRRHKYEPSGIGNYLWDKSLKLAFITQALNETPQ